MHANGNRRTAMKVRDGRVQKKNRHTFTGTLGCVIDRESPGRGFRHVLTKEDLRAFIELFPDWERVSTRLERIVLASCAADWDGLYEFYHREKTGGIFLHAWPEELWIEVSPPYYFDHEAIFARLGVSATIPWAKEGERIVKGHVTCRFTEAQAQAFMLLHVFVHELGHHYFRLQQKHHSSGGSGEAYAEKFATSRWEQLYPKYVDVFGDPARGHG
jgi:hypothetical protein